jgi:uncharacterized protein with PIN domain
MAESLMLRFLADRNVGSLGKWLRLLGFDAEFAEDRNDNEILLRALQEGRVLLTRDRGLKARAPRAVYLVQSAKLQEQLGEVVAHFKLKNRVKPLTRCVKCNVAIEGVSRETVKGSVPPRVFARQSAFFRCPQCGKVYWSGSHAGRVQMVIQTVLAGSRSPGDKMKAEERGE